jgi:hypothetical protein
MADNLPEPKSRKESYLAKAAGMNVTIPEAPESRLEQYLEAIAEGGGGGGGGGAAGKTLTTSDYNWNWETGTTASPNCIAPWLLDDGYYITDNALYFAQEPTPGMDATIESGHILISSNSDSTGPFGDYTNKKVTYLEYGSLIQKVFSYNLNTENEWGLSAFYQWVTNTDVSQILDSRISVNIGNVIPDEDFFGADGQIYVSADSFADPPVARIFVCAGQKWIEEEQKTVFYWKELLTEGTDETYTITTADWTALSASSPYTYQATVTATYAIGNDTTVELVNDNPVLFANYGFAIGSVSGQNVTIYSIGQPSASVSLKVNYKS